MFGKTFFRAIVFCGILLFPLTSHAKANDYVQAGQLTCYKSGEQTNILLHSQFPITCTYKDQLGNTESYTGKTGIALGIALEKVDDAIISFVVLAGGDLKAGNHALAGNFIGGKINLSIGEGGGIDVLVGGGPKNIALQPLAVEETLGTGISAGIGFLVLE